MNLRRLGSGAHETRPRGRRAPSAYSQVHETRALSNLAKSALFSGINAQLGGSAVLTALSLLAAFKEKVTKLNPGDTNKLAAEGGFDISDSAVMAGCLFGGVAGMSG